MKKPDTKKGRRRITSDDLRAAAPQRRRKSTADVVRDTETRLQQAKEREKALINADVLKSDIVRALEAEGIRLSKTTVSNVIAGEHRNAAVERVFCTLTKTDHATMFPAPDGGPHAIDREVTV